MTSVDRQGRTPAHYAAMDNDETRLRALAAAGDAVDVPDREGFTPLHFAALHHASEAAGALVESGVTIDSENIYGNTPLFVAVYNYEGDPTIIQLLREHGADPHHSNKSGQTPAGLAHLIADTNVAEYFADVRG